MASRFLDSTTIFKIRVSKKDFSNSSLANSHSKYKQTKSNYKQNCHLLPSLFHNRNILIIKLHLIILTFLLFSDSYQSQKLNLRVKGSTLDEINVILWKHCLLLFFPSQYKLMKLYYKMILIYRSTFGKLMPYNLYSQRQSGFMVQTSPTPKEWSPTSVYFSLFRF